MQKARRTAYRSVSRRDSCHSASRCPHAGDLVGGDGCSDAAAAKGHAAVDLPTCHGVGHGNDEVGVVAGIDLEGTEINHRVSRHSQLFCQRLLQCKSAVIGGQSHAHDGYLIVDLLRSWSLSGGPFRLAR